MKKQTHPYLTKTLVQTKDGSAYIKRWLFFRGTLPLEIDFLSHSFWRKQRATKSFSKMELKKK